MRDRISAKWKIAVEFHDRRVDPGGISRSFSVGPSEPGPGEKLGYDNREVPLRSQLSQTTLNTAELLRLRCLIARGRIS